MTDTAHPNVNQQTLPDPTSLLNKTEEDLYAIALAEIQNDTRRPGIWAKALSETMGDNQKAQAIYIRLRTAQLANERASQQIQSGKIPYNCPKCGKHHEIRTKIVLECTHNHYWKFKCYDCEQIFDLRKALPELTLKVIRPSSSAGPSSLSTMTSYIDGAWSSGAMIGLVLGTILIPLIGIILGLSNNSAPPEKRKQAKTLLIIGGVVFAIQLILFFISQVIIQAVLSQF